MAESYFDVLVNQVFFIRPFQGRLFTYMFDNRGFHYVTPTVIRNLPPSGT